MKFIIFIADAIRHGNFPRVDQFKHCRFLDRYIYLGRSLTQEEFNEASKRIFSPEFRGDGFTFRPEAISDEVAAALEEEQEAKQKAEQAMLEAEAKRIEEERLAAKLLEEPETESTEAEQSESPEPAAPDQEPAAEPSRFQLDGKGIFVGDERVAGLFGDTKQLRVLAAYDELRPEIEAWLLTLTPSDA